jgi:hypothetical protein
MGVLLLENSVMKELNWIELNYLLQLLILSSLLSSTYITVYPRLQFKLEDIGLRC